MTPSEQLRVAATRLRCGHSFPLRPPHGTLANPGDCKDCGAPFFGVHDDVDEELREPLATLLDEHADRADLTCDDPTGVCSPCERDSTIPAAHALAEAINGGAA